MKKAFEVELPPHEYLLLVSNVHFNEETVKLVVDGRIAWMDTHNAVGTYTGGVRTVLKHDKERALVEFSCKGEFTVDPVLLYIK